MRAIRNIASAGRTVVCTIHQPSEEIFGMFDNLLLLQRGGEVVYFGDLGPKAQYTRGDGTTAEYNTSKNLTDHLAKQIPGSKKKDDENPAEFMLNCLLGAKNKYSGHDKKMSISTTPNQSPEEARVEQINVPMWWTP